MVADPGSGNHVTCHWIPLSVQMYEYVIATLLIFTLCLSLCTCVYMCFSMCIYQFCFPVLTSGFLWCENPSPPGWRPVFPPIGDSNPLGSPRSPRKKKKTRTKHKQTKKDLHLSHSRSRNACFVVWLLHTWRVVPWEEVGKGKAPSHLSGMHRVERNSGPRWALPLICACSKQCQGRKSSPGLSHFF